MPLLRKSVSIDWRCIDIVTLSRVMLCGGQAQCYIMLCPAAGDCHKCLAVPTDTDTTHRGHTLPWLAPSTQLCSLLTLSSAVQCCSGRGVSSTDGVGVQCLVSCWCWLPRPGPATLLEKTMVPQLAAAPRTLHTPASTMVT